MGAENQTDTDFAPDRRQNRNGVVIAIQIVWAQTNKIILVAMNRNLSFFIKLQSDVV